jgi:O-antigen/teichoic acid export membrane protein
MSVLSWGRKLPPSQIRFRDSLPIRVGGGIIGAVIAFFLALEIVYVVWGFNPEVGPLGLYAFFLIFVGIFFMVVGIGQTIVRRRENRRIPS